MDKSGFVNTISTDFASGSAAPIDGRPAHVYAVLGGRVLGTALADCPPTRRQSISAPGHLGFSVVFEHPIDPAEVDQIELIWVGSADKLPRSPHLRTEDRPARQVFILGAARSGTSALGSALSLSLDLAWLGEGHAAHLFAEAASPLATETDGSHRLVRFIAENKLRRQVIRMARFAYFASHDSASFVEKTPGHMAIGASPFMAECFPDAKFIYLQRNGIANVMSRLVKFGRTFDKHCIAWVASIEAWQTARAALPAYLEIRQEDMMANPAQTAARIAAYLEAPDITNTLADALAPGTVQYTGAGAGGDSLAATKWTPEQKALFITRCGPAMDQAGYAY